MDNLQNKSYYFKLLHQFFEANCLK